MPSFIVNTTLQGRMSSISAPDVKKLLDLL
jgi:hypothetical protein